ncbi:lipid kinase YegS [Stutzerimonas urumqiensis]|uniref:lipid kinase YegS n=1 Tax=Stutzerimonas urumqiensis TaxID=638269 RepID=UPI000EAFA7AC|nr:lipid kinase YegS [Stutzerimonas urumqiensis]
MNDAKAFLVLHGKQACNDEVREAVKAQRELGWDIAVRLTWEAGDARRATLDALDAGYPTVIAGGGDGTLRDVCETLVTARAQASLAMMPLGTANDFARSAGVPALPFDALALLDEPAVTIDIGQMNDHFFLNMATGGFGSKVTATTSEELKKMLGGGAYLLTGLTHFADVHSMYGEFDGPDFHWAGEFLAIGIGNGRQAGGGQVLCPQASVDDGLLDLCIVPAPEGPLDTLSTLFNGSLHGVDSVAVTARLANVRVQAPEPVYVNLDGEPLCCRDMQFSVRPKALRVHLPAHSPLLRDALPLATEPMPGSG